MKIIAYIVKEKINTVLNIEWNSFCCTLSLSLTKLGIL